MAQFQDKKKEFAAYRMLLAGVNLVLDMAIVLSAAILVPQMSAFAMCLICFVVAAGSLIFQIRIDHTLIFTGQFLVEDGDSLYAVIGTFGLGFGRRHRRKRQVNAYRYYYMDSVRETVNRSYGIRVKADVWTAGNNIIDADQSVFGTPGVMKQLLMEQGKKKTVVFRIEHNLTEKEETRLLKELYNLKEAAGTMKPVTAAAGE